MPEETYQPDAQPQDDFDRDLHPAAQAGINVAGVGPDYEDTARTAYDVKAAHRNLQGLADDELKSISVLPHGARLRQGAIYIDLRDPDCRELKATGEMTAGADNLYVPKDEVDYQLWNRLIGVQTPERRGE